MSPAICQIWDLTQIARSAMDLVAQHDADMPKQAVISADPEILVGPTHLEPHGRLWRER